MITHPYRIEYLSRGEWIIYTTTTTKDEAIEVRRELATTASHTRITTHITTPKETTMSTLSNHKITRTNQTTFTTSIFCKCGWSGHSNTKAGADSAAHDHLSSPKPARANWRTARVPAGWFPATGQGFTKIDRRTVRAAR